MSGVQIAKHPGELLVGLLERSRSLLDLELQFVVSLLKFRLGMFDALPDPAGDPFQGKSEHEDRGRRQRGRGDRRRRTPRRGGHDMSEPGDHDHGTDDQRQENPEQSRAIEGPHTRCKRKRRQAPRPRRVPSRAARTRWPY